MNRLKKGVGILEKLFYSNKDICEIYCISPAQAYRHMKRMREMYGIDKTRLPRKGMLPVAIVKDYFHQSKTKKDTQPSTKLTSV